MPPLPKQLHNQGLTSLTDKTTWNVKVTDQSGLILGVIPGHEARVIFTTDDYVPKGIPVPEKVKVSFKDAQKIKISNEFATVDHAKQISMLKAMMTGKGDHGEAI